MVSLQIRCKCGKVLRVPETLAGKKVACPGCKCAYRVSAERFAATKKPVAISPGPPKESASEIELPSIDPASSPSELNLLEGIELAPPGPVCPTCKLPQPVDARICVQCGIDLVTGKSVLKGKSSAPSAVGYARGQARGGGRTRGKGDAIGEPTRSYRADTLLSFIYPFKSVNNSITFAIIAAIACVKVLLILPGFFMLMGRLIISGWLAALYLTVVQNTAMAVEDLPGIKMEDGPLDDIIKPGLKYIGAYACALLPAAIYTILLATDVLPAFMQSDVVLLLWLAAGIFVWPIMVMLFAFDALSMVYRVDLFMTTIFRTFVPYLCLWLVLLLVGATSFLPFMIPLLDGVGVKLDLSFLKGGGLALLIFLQILDVYLTIVAMRQIGLYYLHFKNRFTFLFE